MSKPIHLAFLWHQHQPYYKDMLSGHLEMPWVRLHGIKDYYGMAAMIDRHEGIKCTINFVPSLLAQLDDYLKGTEDIWQTLSRFPAESLNVEQRRFLLDNFFLVNVNTMIRPFPRYFELFSKRGGDAVTEKTLTRYSEKDIRDLQVLANMAWFHPISLHNDELLNYLIDKGSDYSEEDKTKLLAKQMEILAQIVPLHRKLQDAGRIELSTTPFYHPIIPLLVDEHSVHEAMPGVPLPRRLYSMAGDAHHQIKTAYEYHERLFGRPPRGMWPSEGSVSQEAAELFASTGIKWIATDQLILAHSRSSISPADRHHYRPYILKGLSSPMQIVFRDHQLSDLLSFQYQYYREQDAVSDFISRVREIAKRETSRPACIFVILDGENAWEHYRQSAAPFFDLFYEELLQCDDIILTTVGDYVESSGSTANIDRLAAGSWINGDFSIWAGHSEDVTAWDYLDHVREDLRNIAKSKGTILTPEQLCCAWEEVFIAQGSDYFWWFGEDHSSAQDREFDALFRMHLKNVYRHLGEHYPDFLNVPIKMIACRQLFKHPTAMLNVKIDGKVSSFLEWQFAGRYEAGADYGSMSRVAKARLQDVFFGFDIGHLYVRVDLGLPVTEMDGAVVIDIRKPVPVQFFYSTKSEADTLYRNRDESDRVGVAAFKRVFEAKIPLADLEASVGTEIDFQIQFEDAGRIIEVLPRGGVFCAKVPPADFDFRNWGL